MKIVKLNRRFRQFKEQGHTVAFRFPNGYTKDAGQIEKACRERLAGGGWMRQNDWYTWYGSRPGKYDVRPFWISFRSEADATLVLLSADLSKNT